MNHAKTIPDLTDRQSKPGGGMCHKLLYLCKHKGLRGGGRFIGKVPAKCPVCNKEPK